MNSPKRYRKMGCQECGMVEGPERPEYHPYALCLLVKACEGDMDAAREHMASIVLAARSQAPELKMMVDRFMGQVKRDA